MAKEFGVTKLEVQMDNLACIQVLQNENYQGGECVHIIRHCRSLIEASDWEVRVIHCYREGNKAADKLANIGVDQTSSVSYFNNPLPEIISLLRDDVVGITTPRII